MKHSWSLDYLNKKYSPREFQEWRRKKHLSQSVKYGVPFTSYQAHGALRIIPFLDFNIVEQLNPITEYEQYLIETIGDCIDGFNFLTFTSNQRYCSNGKTFAAIHNLTGIDVIEILQAAKFMIKVLDYDPIVDRMGKCVGLKRR